MSNPGDRFPIIHQTFVLEPQVRLPYSALLYPPANLRFERRSIVIKSKLFVSVLFFGALRSMLGDAMIVQPSIWSGNGTDVGNGWTSQANSSFSGYRTFDNFSFQSSTTLSQVTWLGIYLNDNLTNASPNTTTWDLGFFADNAGTPGAVASDTTQSAAQVSTLGVGTGLFNGNTVTLYQFTATFPDFTAVAGKTYWFSPLSEADTFDPLFSWIEGTGEGNTSFQEQLAITALVTPSAKPMIQTGINATFVRPGDRAFTLNPVPEPDSFVLIVLALGGLAILRRR
jgi:hypothetical protein